MTKRTYSGEERAKLVMRGLQSGIVITRFCAEQGISRATFYRWRNLFFTGLSKFMSTGRKELSKSSRLKQTKGYKKPNYRCRIK
jgi:transposase-like protein